MNIFQWGKRQAEKVNTKLPFVNLIGHEKVYGHASKKDMNIMVSQYKSWTYACIQRISFAIARTPLKVYKKVIGKDGMELEEVTEHPFIDLLQNVNPFFNKFELWSLSDIFLETTGNAYWWLPRGRLGVPAVIWNIPSPWIKPIPSKEKFIDGYALQPPGYGKPIRLEEEEIVHFKYPSPFDLWLGHSPTVGAAYGIDLNNHIKEWGIHFFMNNASPGGVLTTDDPISAEASQRLRDLWNSYHKGVGKAGRMAILGGGLKYQKIGSNLSDMAYQDISRSIRDEILAIFGVPASKLGLVEDVNRANAEANDYTFQKETILPRLILIEEKINEKIMPMYDQNLVVKFDNPVPEDKEFRLKEKTEHIRSGYSSIDDEREKDGEERYELPETVAPLIPFSLAPAGERPEEPEKPGEEPQEEKPKKIAKGYRERKWKHFVLITGSIERLFKTKLADYFAELHKEVMLNLNKYKAIQKAGIGEDTIGNIVYEEVSAELRLQQVSRPYIRESFVAGVNIGAEEVGLDFNLIEPNVARAIDDRILFFAKKVNESTLTLISNEIKEAIENGETMTEVAQRMDKVFNFSEKYRSQRVAQTEVIGATNHGQLESYKEAGVEEKEWLTASDEKVRSSHRNMRKKKAKTLDVFITGNGSNLLYPGDRSSGAPAGDIINCRCTLIPANIKE